MRQFSIGQNVTNIITGEQLKVTYVWGDEKWVQVLNEDGMKFVISSLALKA